MNATPKTNPFPYEGFLERPRLFFVADNEANALCAVCHELQLGRNELSIDEAERFSRQLAESAREGQIGKLRRQASRRLWELFHDAYEDYPSWLR